MTTDGDKLSLTFEAGMSPALRTLIQHERDDIERVTQRTVQMILSSVSDYALSSDARIVEDLGRSSRINAELWFAALLDGQSVTQVAMAPIVAFARRRVHQGISLPGLLRAYRVIARAFWLRMLEAAGEDTALKAELASSIAPFLLQHFDVVAEGIASTYLLEQSQHARWRDRLRQELWSIVRSRPDDMQGFRQHTEALGLAGEQPHCALALRLSPEACAHPERFVDLPLLCLARRRQLGTPDALMRVIHRDHLVVWVPQPGGQTATAFERELGETAAQIVDTVKIVQAIGVGLPGMGAHGWQASMEQGLRVLAEPADEGTPMGVHRYSRIMIEDAIRSTDNIAEFVRSTIDALAADPVLIETLQSYLKHDLQRKNTAKALSVHPNTLDHRLARIETLLGGRLADVDWLERVNAALRLHRSRP